MSTDGPAATQPVADSSWSGYFSGAAATAQQRFEPAATSPVAAPTPTLKRAGKAAEPAQVVPKPGQSLGGPGNMLLDEDGVPVVSPFENNPCLKVNQSLPQPPRAIVPCRPAARIALHPRGLKLPISAYCTPPLPPLPGMVGSISTLR